MIGIGDVKCVSVLSLFCELKYRGFAKEDIEPYYRSYEKFCHQCKQYDFKVWIEDRGWKRTSIPSSRLLDEIYNNEIEELGRGELKHIKRE